MQWEAIYHDGSSETGIDSGVGLVDRTKLKSFIMRDNGASEPFFIARFPEDGSKKLIFRRRTVRSMGGKPDVVVYLVGWHENVNGKSVKSICYIHEDGLVEFDDSRSDLELIPVEEF